MLIKGIQWSIGGGAQRCDRLRVGMTPVVLVDESAYRSTSAGRFGAFSAGAAAVAAAERGILGVVDDDWLVGGSSGMPLRLSGQGRLVTRVKIWAGA